MTLYNIFATHIKIQIRKFFFANRLTLTFLNWLSMIGIGFFLYNIGIFLSFTLNEFGDNISLIKGQYFIPMFFLFADMGLKYFFKRPDFSFLSLKRFPVTGRILPYMYLGKEMFSFWNLYSILILLPILLGSIYQTGGMFAVILGIAAIYITQILISMLAVYVSINKWHTMLAFSTLAILVYVNIHISTQYGVREMMFILFFHCLLAGIANFFLLKRNIEGIFIFDQLSSSTTSKRLFLQKMKTEHTIPYFILFGLKMLWRSSVLRKQLIIATALTILYIYIFNTIVIIPDSPIFTLFITSFLFSVFPLLFGQYLFSAESTFFDKLSVIPRLHIYLLSKYLLNIVFMIFSFITFMIFTNLKSYFEILAIFIYCAGPVTLSSFVSILFANTRLNLFGKIYEMQGNGFSAQSWVVMISYLLCLSIVIIVYTFSLGKDVHIYFMVIAGIGTTILSGRWLNFLLVIFSRKKHKKLESFRN